MFTVLINNSEQIPATQESELNKIYGTFWEDSTNSTSAAELIDRKESDS